ncbi:MAG: glycosyltransferase family 2 protein [Deltaproteobacteria bacterium]|nr:glycosyltransferase family 2 protein [Deltaproteobacteria bacterium]
MEKRPETSVDISVVVPIYNEMENIPPLTERVLSVMRGMSRPFELILVDDGSSDGSRDVYGPIADREPELKIVRFRRNFGQTAAMAAGFDIARGEIVVSLDGDLQNPPEEIPRLVERLEGDDLDLVSGWRRDRRDGAVSRKLPSFFANRIISRITGVKLHDYGCSLKAYRAEVLRDVQMYGELHRFLPVLVSMEGGRIAEMEVRHASRTMGRSKYGISRTYRVLMDLLTVTFLKQYGDRPQHAFGYFGVALFGGGFLIDGYLAALKLFTGADIGARPLLLLGTLMIIAGIQLLSIGLLSEVMARTYYESQGKPRYRIREIVGE